MCSPCASDPRARVLSTFWLGRDSGGAAGGITSKKSHWWGGRGEGVPGERQHGVQKEGVTKHSGEAGRLEWPAPKWP